MKQIKKIKLKNFKKFRDSEINFHEEKNILIGDNEAGKSTILTAIELVLGGSKNKVESIGLESIFNTDAVKEFLSGDKKESDLPILHVEIFLNEQDNPDLNGRNNTDNADSDGLKLVCEPIEELGGEIRDVLAQDESNFPFEYYSVKFSTFSGEAYSGYRKFLRHLSIDSSQINSEYATREYIKTVYESLAEQNQRITLRNEYRLQKKKFVEETLERINKDIDKYQFSVRTGSKSNLEADLTITEDDIALENRGKGRQCFIKTEFALTRNGDGQSIDTLLLEEPENHLSHTNMKKLINRISNSEAKQIFIATHNSLISTRLDLRNTILLNSNSASPITLEALPEDTAKFFMKAPDNNILEFILSSKVILVEGDAEYILIGALYESVTARTLEDDDVHIISVGGTSFKRYLDLAKLLNIRVAVVRDNDGDYENNCAQNYSDYLNDNISVFYDKDNDKSTFEICFYQDNKGICDELFLPGRRTLTALEFMLKNKADCAFELLDKKAGELISPTYLSRAIEWINE
ncbi:MULTISPECIES: ATP-dependent nuclease [unclassified Halomonas]|uniref:ATP-dependent nuclease n=1 Tax=unclassified Halomonas TaxID=2609666 RepID=UPI0009908056|nr:MULTISPECIES: AAA family ATPase [unclassified Halomonas]AQU82661.1 ATP-dependent endonuclease [Halomonas sp. 'Soap Lake \